MAEMDEILQTFLSFDRDGNGFIDREEFAELVKVAGASMNPDRVDEAFQAVDIDGNGVIDFNEFIRWWYERMERKKASEETAPRARTNSMPVARISPVKQEVPAAPEEPNPAVLALQEKLNIATQCESAAKAETSAVRAELRAARETIERQGAAMKTLEGELKAARAQSGGGGDEGNLAALKASRDRLARENRDLRREFEKFTERLAKLRDNAIDALFQCGED